MKQDARIVLDARGSRAGTSHAFAAGNIPTVKVPENRGDALSDVGSTLTRRRTAHERRWQLTKIWQRMSTCRKD